MDSPSKKQPRILSLDQFRGYSVFGMFLINFLGRFHISDTDYSFLTHHPSIFSYADSIMPHFFFVVGFVYRLTFLNRVQSDGLQSARRKALNRSLSLILLGLVLYHLDVNFLTWDQLRQLSLWDFLTTAFQRLPFQALVHIGLTSLWILPVIGKRAIVRILYALFSLSIFFWCSESFYYDWVMTRPGIDGGPLGFLSWSVPMLTGSLVYDAVSAHKNHQPILWILKWAGILMTVGYGLSCLSAASSPNIWTMSQRAGSVSYQIFGAGFSMLVYVFFLWMSDIAKHQISFFNTLGVNALTAYLIEDFISSAVNPLAPKDSPTWYALGMFGIYFWLCYFFLRYMEKKQIFLRL